DLKNVTTICQGLWDRPGKMAAVSTGAGHQLEESIDTTTPQADVDTLDNVIRNRNISALDFVKIDTPVGGYNILLGSKEIINRYRPKLAVSIHSNNGLDYFRVPKLIEEILPGGYRFYIRHYARRFRYTILYASPVTV